MRHIAGFVGQPQSVGMVVTCETSKLVGLRVIKTPAWFIVQLLWDADDESEVRRLRQLGWERGCTAVGQCECRRQAKEKLRLAVSNPAATSAVRFLLQSAVEQFLKNVDEHPVDVAMDLLPQALSCTPDEADTDDYKRQSAFKLDVDSWIDAFLAMPVIEK